MPAIAMPAAAPAERPDFLPLAAVLGDVVVLEAGVVEFGGVVDVDEEGIDVCDEEDGFVDDGIDD